MMEPESNVEKKGNTEYQPTKCRVTKPPPPKPAANPMQFVKVAPCPLIQKAQDQVKKFEETKIARQEVREEAEDWQLNLDSWRNNRRKRQEHIIERVVEVKKNELEDHDRAKRKNKTFNEMVEERKGRQRLNIPIYNDEDGNDLSDYGIGSSSSKTNSIKDVDTDDNSSVLDEKDYAHSNKESSNSNQSQSEDETNTKTPIEKDEEQTPAKRYVPPKIQLRSSFEFLKRNAAPEETLEPKEQYTYEGAIQDYRTRIRTKINFDESVFNKSTQDYSKIREEVESVVPKGNIFKRKVLFESAESRNVKEFEQILPKGSFSKRREIFEGDDLIKKTKEDLMCEKALPDLDDYNSITPSNYAPSTSSTDLMTMSSDREDSGIQTSDVSCSVSQSDEQCEEIETIPKCIEQLSVVKETENHPEVNEPNELDESKEAETYQSAPQQTVDNLIGNQNPSSSFENLKTIIEEFITLEIKNALPPLKIIKPQLEPKPPQIIYENVDLSGNLDFMNPATKLEPPKVKPPPPPPEDQVDGDQEAECENNFRRINSTKRIKKEIHIKRSSFLGLDEPTEDQIHPEVCIDKPPDINSFLEKEKCLYKKLQDSRGGSQDSGLEIERGRLSSDTWCSSIADFSTPIHERQDSEQTSSFTSEEDEITKKEREIIELVEKEEKSRDSDYSSQTTLSPVNTKCISTDTYDTLGSEKFDRPYFPMNTYRTNLDDEDSEVLRVEAELKQLELEEFERQRENMLFREKLRQNRHSLENICDARIYPQTYNDKVNYRKSMPELQVASEYRKPHPEVPNYHHPSPEIDYQYRKSMPDIQHAYNRSVSDYCNNGRMNIEYRKKLGNKEQHETERFVNKLNPIEMDNVQHGNKQVRPLTRHSLHVLSAVPKPRHNDNWITPKANPEVKSYNQHWLYQEAELRRISEQNSNMRNWQQQHQDIGDQRILNRANGANMPPTLRSVRPEHSPTKEYFEHPYLGHAQPLSYPPHVQLADNQDKMLSVSGKKKCSNCSNELGRGAAMIIESLCLFYHMECFKCCVCHMRLGDGRMGTDVRVRNQKLHCHNCYSSEDGVKFSCV
ncbi:LIM domain only protein 7 isoform X2 [Onthophagus taurus]|uniref:LIM domain only protein 7 isoform X2 n=1 Tax=Onthophagus taurus TaxID=166361 RepID=UPI0039BE7702